jgi:hypothetical protein
VVVVVERGREAQVVVVVVGMVVLGWVAQVMVEGVVVEVMVMVVLGWVAQGMVVGVGMGMVAVG